MELIRPRLRDHIDHAARVHPVLRSKSGGFHAELGDCIGEGVRKEGAGHVVAVVGAVQTP